MTCGTENRNLIFSMNVDTRRQILRGNLFNPILGIRGSPKDFTPRFDTFVPMGSKEAKAVKGEASRMRFSKPTATV